MQCRIRVVDSTLKAAVAESGHGHSRKRWKASIGIVLQIESSPNRITSNVTCAGIPLVCTRGEAAKPCCAFVSINLGVRSPVRRSHQTGIGDVRVSETSQPSKQEYVEAALVAVDFYPEETGTCRVQEVSVPVRVYFEAEWERKYAHGPSLEECRREWKRTYGATGATD